MAKKATKKSGKSSKPVSKGASKPAMKSKKAPAKKAAPKKSATKRSPSGPVVIKTGSGMTPHEVGSKLVADFNSGVFHMTEMWSPAIISIEGMGVSQA